MHNKKKSRHEFIDAKNKDCMYAYGLTLTWKQHQKINETKMTKREGNKY